jgi:transposase InsO family protein
LTLVSGKGNDYDNGVVESFFKTIKTELVWKKVSLYDNRQQEGLVTILMPSITQSKNIRHWGTNHPYRRRLL